MDRFGTSAEGAWRSVLEIADYSGSTYTRSPLLQSIVAPEPDGRTVAVRCQAARKDQAVTRDVDRGWWGRLEPYFDQLLTSEKIM